MVGGLFGEGCREVKANFGKNMEFGIGWRSIIDRISG